MSKLCLYYDLLSQPSRTLYILLSKAAVPFQPVQIRLGQGEHMTEEYGRINPRRQVPAISHGDFNLAESVGIVRYLSREMDLADKWYPRESKAQARVDEFLEYHHIGLRIHLGLYFRVMWLEPLMTKKAPKAEFEAMLKKNMVQACDQFNNIWLADKPFICGDTITVADLFAACEIEQPKLAGYDARDGRPALKDWLERVRAETNPYYDEAHSSLNKLATKYKGKSPGLVSKN